MFVKIWFGELSGMGKHCMSRCLLILLVMFSAPRFSMAADKDLTYKKIQSLENQIEELKIQYNDIILKYSELTASDKLSEVNLSVQKNKLEEISFEISEVGELIKTSDYQSIGYSLGVLQVVLASVSVLVTILGVGIAMLTIWGYKNIKEASIDASTKEAVNASKIKIQDAIQSGDFNEVVGSAVNKELYRGVLSDQDFPVDEGEGQ